MKKYKLLLLSACLFTVSSCSSYLDIVPDNVATIESAFTLRNTAERYLFTCYSWMPSHMNLTSDPAMLGGGELTSLYPQNTISGFLYSRGEQNAVEPILNYWSGGLSASSLYQGIRDCNIFLDNIDKVFDITEEERSRWVAEVKFLKAYYHFYLVRLYGPIPLIKENLPISAGVLDVKVYRNTVDECFEYIVSLLDEAIPNLPELIVDPNFEAGRITAPVAASMKAKILVTAASPFYNGNTEYASFVDNTNKQLFNQQFDAQKWVKAADACKEAIDMCERLGYKLYEFEPLIGQSLTQTTKYQMNVRNSVCEKWNTEAIWSDPNSVVNQAGISPRSWNPSLSNAGTAGRYSPGISFVDLFYTKNGLPIEQDATWDYDGRYDLKVATANDRYNIEPAYTTVKMHFERENRFYASIGFDGGKWYGQGKYDDSDMWTIKGKLGQHTGIVLTTNYSPTGYWPKKLVHYQNYFSGSGSASYSVVWYPVVIMRLADLYLLYAEAKNEVDGSNAESYKYINKVRNRSGLIDLEDAWTNFAKNPTYHTTKEGLREIIHQERQIELAFEAHRLYDLRRWKKAIDVLNEPIKGWSVNQSTVDAYYKETTVFTPDFKSRNQLEPIKDKDLLTNMNLVQNPGW